jgi:hypothetical protein
MMAIDTFSVAQAPVAPPMINPVARNPSATIQTNFVKRFFGFMFSSFIIKD